MISSYVMIAILSTAGLEFNVVNSYPTFGQCMEAKENLRELDGVTLVVSTCIRKEIK